MIGASDKMTINVPQPPARLPRQTMPAPTFRYSGVSVHINPRTDGGPGHLSTDGGGRITAPRRSRKRSKLETCSKRHWIRTDELYNFY